LWDGFTWLEACMKIGTKITAVTFSAILITTATAVLVQQTVLRNQSIDLIKSEMKSTLMAADNARASTSLLVEKHAFDSGKLLQELRQASDFRHTTLYHTIPVVAACGRTGGAPRAAEDSRIFASRSAVAGH